MTLHYGGVFIMLIVEFAFEDVKQQKISILGDFKINDLKLVYMKT